MHTASSSHPGFSCSLGCLHHLSSKSDATSEFPNLLLRFEEGSVGGEMHASFVICAGGVSQVNQTECRISPSETAGLALLLGRGERTASN